MAIAPSFDEMEAIAHAELQEEFGSEWAYTPMVAKPNLPPQPDTTRVAVPRLIGTFGWQSKDVKLGLQEVEIASREPCLFLHRDCAPQGMRKDDRFTRLNDGLLFRIVKVDKDGYSGIEVQLEQLGRHS